MQKDLDAAKEWYETHGVSNRDWEEYDDVTKQLIALEATFDEWEAVADMREHGPGFNSVSVFFDPDKLACTGTPDYNLAVKEDDRSLAAYLAQNAQGNLGRLLTGQWARVENVKYTNRGSGYIEVIVSPN